MNRENLISDFCKLYGADGEIRLFFAPGRVNLIGDHIDYNGGHILPCALTIGTYAAARVRKDRLVRLMSRTEGGGRIEFSLDDELKPGSDTGWEAFPKGIFYLFAKSGFPISKGVDILYDEDIPHASGLSSKASLKMVTAVLLRDLFFNPELSNYELAQMAMLVEPEYTGGHRRVMGPFASAMGVREHALFLTVHSLHYECVPLGFEGKRIVITNSMIRNDNIRQIYEQRREECAKAFKKLRSVTNADCLCGINTDRFESCKDVIMNETYTKRARHAVYENARSIRAVSALRVRNLKRFGELMNASHVSLRDDFEMSCPELDFLTETAWTCPGVIGSRMTGAGLGGCTVSIVEEAGIEQFMDTLGHSYRQKFGIDPEFYLVETDDGAREITSR